jgi:hypothetical protein
MTPIRRFACVLVSLVLLAGARGAVGETPAGYAWDAARTVNVASATWSNDEIAAFIESITSAHHPVTVGDFRFVDLAGNGKLELVASVDYSGRRFFNTILVVRRTGRAFGVQALPALDVESLSGVVVDLKADGVRQLVVPTPLTPYLGARYPQAKWTAVYARSGAVYVESTAAFAAYYEAAVVPNLRRALANAARASDAMVVALANIEYDKAVRVLAGGDSGAGIATAQALAGSADPSLRIWGAAILADIGTPASTAMLGSLRQDADAAVTAHRGAARGKARTARCDRVDISVLGTVNLAASDPIRVTIRDQGRVRHSAIVAESATFGQAGVEPSLVACNGGNKADGNGIECRFGARESGLQAGDGVATLYAKRADGTCVVGQDAIEVVDE